MSRDNLIDRTSSPDANAGGLLRDAVEALRYEVPRPLDTRVSHPRQAKAQFLNRC